MSMHNQPKQITDLLFKRMQNKMLNKAGQSVQFKLQEFLHMLVERFAREKDMNLNAAAYELLSKAVIEEYQDEVEGYLIINGLSDERETRQETD